uniref:sulfate transport system permease protein n=1 Tax=Galdieria phlegrea TaxID=1389228 RepID=UPI0023D7D7AB|nr:sulfate transport system permease protein [Galdieria phlegrea]WDA99834.1 sulfate transport system permease protein [Galdieria phlegrea]
MAIIFKHYKNLNLFLLVLYLSIFLFLPIVNLIVIVFKISFKDIFIIATNPVALYSYLLTLKLSFVATVLNIIFGSCIAYLLTYFTFWGKDFIDICVDIPLALPTSLAGLAFYKTYNPNSTIAQILNLVFRIQLVYSPIAVIVVMTFVSLPFVIRSLQPILLELDANKELKEIAWCLGANSWQTFCFVIFPYIRPSLITGAVLSFARAIGEYGSIIIVSSNLPYKDLVTSVLIAQKLEQYDYKSATVIGSIMLSVSILILLIVNLLNPSKYD